MRVWGSRFSQLANIRRSFLPHPVYGLLQNSPSYLLQQLLTNLCRTAAASDLKSLEAKSGGKGELQVYLRGGAVSAHAPSVWTQVTILQSLMILRWRHGSHTGTVGETQALRQNPRFRYTTPTCRVQTCRQAVLTDTSSPSRSSSTTTVSPADPNARSCNTVHVKTLIIRKSNNFCTASETSF